LFNGKPEATVFWSGWRIRQARRPHHNADGFVGGGWLLDAAAHHPVVDVYILENILSAGL
jgi:hypothetical protein